MNACDVLIVVVSILGERLGWQEVFGCQCVSTGRGSASITHQKVDSQPVSMGRMGKPRFSWIIRCQCIELNCDAGHYWPDDPLIAEPTARIKPRK